MSRSSEKASNIAEELLDYVHPGMTHAAAIEEIATMIDEMNGDLLRVVNAMLSEEERVGPTRHAVLMNHLREIASNYQPLHCAVEDQHELFAPLTHTETAVAGQMP